MFHAWPALVLTPEQICQWGSARAANSNKVIAIRTDSSVSRSLWVSLDETIHGNGKIQSVECRIQKYTCWDGAWHLLRAGLPFRHKTKKYGREEPVVYDGDEQNGYKS